VQPRRDQAARPSVLPWVRPRRAAAADLSAAGALEGVAAAAALRPTDTFDLSWAYVYEDDEALLRGLLAAGGVGDAAGAEREPELRAGLLRALAPFRTAAGGYRLENEWHTVVSTA
jgi:hypothetical protein